MITNRLFFSTSGAQGQLGSDGTHGNSFGQNGSDGTHGKMGQHAKDIKLSISADEFNKQVILKVNAESYRLPLGDPLAAIFVKANGGNGGKGGDGGRGGDGYCGSNGADATQIRSGSNGGDGGPGGNGGNAGNGGDGGNGGLIDVYVDNHDMDFLMLFKKIEVKAGAGGRGGDGGRYGSGGLGGSGGGSYSWMETVYTPTIDSEGVLHMITGYEPRSNSGGRSGWSGADGRFGDSGKHGNSGKSGDIKFHVRNNSTYSDLYDLSLEELKISSENGIFEPGETVQVNKIVLKNSGKMPTPSHQPISISLVNNPWVIFDEKNSRKITIPIAPSKNYILHEPFSFTVEENKSPLLADTTYYETASLKVNARLERVNYFFPQVIEKITSFDISYPVKISTIAMPGSIVRNEKAPFVIQLQNVSTQPLGLKASQPRLLEINLFLPSILKHMRAEFLEDKKELSGVDGSLTFPVLELKPYEIKNFAGTVQFTEDAPVHAEAIWDVQLQLGKINDLTRKHIIAKRSFVLQLSESYEYKSTADFVLVINNNIPKKIIEQWQDVSIQFGTSMGIWDTSLYSGLSYTKKRKDQRSLLDDMKDKVIIILNYPNKDDKQFPTEYLDAMEIFNAAKNENISTYVIGTNFDLTKAILPLSKKEQKDISIQRNYFSTPTFKDLQKEIGKQQSEFKKHHPDRKFIAYERFNPEMANKSSFAFKKSWKVGEMHFAEGIGRKDGHIAFRMMTHIAQPDEIDVYQIIKLLPFYKKLLYIDQSAPAYKDAIKKAIISDLADELSICRAGKWKEKAKSIFDLQYFYDFAKYKFKDKESFLDILIHYDYLVERVKSTWDFNAKYHRRKELYQVCREQVSELFNLHFKLKDYLLKKNILQTRWLGAHRKEVYAHYSKPYGKAPQMDSDILLNTNLFMKELSKYHPKNSTFNDNFSICDTEEGLESSFNAYKKMCYFP